MQIEVGKKYGRLTVLEKLPGHNVRCLCECGNIKTARDYNVIYGKTRSCGCLFSEGNNWKHGGKGTRLYIIWKGIRERCNTPSCTAYKRYGGRGITVCEEWDDFQTFRAWAMSHGYKDGLTIDRIDSNGNYEPSNCRWATYKQQANNMRSNRWIEYGGQKKTLTQWAEYSGIKVATLWSRLEHGWSVEKALTKGARHDWHNKTDHRLAV
jgi:hypothetical protein